MKLNEILGMGENQIDVMAYIWNDNVELHVRPRNFLEITKRIKYNGKHHDSVSENCEKIEKEMALKADRIAKTFGTMLQTLMSEFALKVDKAIKEVEKDDQIK